MAFFDSLRRVLGAQPHATDVALEKSTDDWGDGGSTHPGPSSDSASGRRRGARPEPATTTSNNARKKLKRILEKLPASQAEWDPMLAEGRALGLDDQFMLKSQIDEFMLLVRRAVADRQITEQEHRNLELARTLIGMTEEDAEALLHAVAAEAQEFFGKPVEGA